MSLWYSMKWAHSVHVLRFFFLSSNVSTPFICSQLRLMDWCEKRIWFFVQSILLCFSLFFCHCRCSVVVCVCLCVMDYTNRHRTCNASIFYAVIIKSFIEVAANGEQPWLLAQINIAIITVTQHTHTHSYCAGATIFSSLSLFQVHRNSFAFRCNAFLTAVLCFFCTFIDCNMMKMMCAI